MNIRTHITLGLAIITSFIIATVTGTSAAQAQSAANAAQGVEISPALVELNGAPGGTYTINLTVTNVTASDLFYTTSVDDFSARDESGTPQILLDSNLPASASIKSWVNAPSSFTLKARESRKVVAEVVIPSDAEPGGHYGVLRFAGQAPELDTTGVGLSASAGTLFLVRVDGEIVEKASLAEFFTAQNGSQSGFFESGPVTFVTRIKNEGNIHVKPSGSIELKDTFGNIVATLAVNKDQSNVLPDSIRRFEAEFNAGWMFGLYTANVTLGYGSTGQAITATTTFWVIPYKPILIAIAALVTLGYVFRRVIKVYNKHIINKAKNEHATKAKKPSKKK